MDLEMQLVHTYADGSVGAILGVLFDRVEGGDTDNSFIASLDFANATEEGFELSNVDLKTFLDDLPKGDFWSYNGSRTTPPCTEGVKWTVLSGVQPICDAQLKAFTDKHTGNYRAVQPLHDRIVYYASASAKALAAGVLAITTMLAF